MGPRVRRRHTKKVTADLAFRLWQGPGAGSIPVRSATERVPAGANLNIVAALTAAGQPRPDPVGERHRPDRLRPGLVGWRSFRAGHPRRPCWWGTLDSASQEPSAPFRAAGSSPGPQMCPWRWPAHLAIRGASGQGLCQSRPPIGRRVRPTAFRSIRGDPLSELNGIAEQTHADAVVVGVSEHLGHRVLGSPAIPLARSGKWPVIVVS